MRGICYDFPVETNHGGCKMTDTTPTPSDEKQKNSSKIKRRLILLGIFLALVGAYEVGDLIMRIAHPSM